MTIVFVGFDLAKAVFALHGVDSAGGARFNHFRCGQPSLAVRSSIKTATWQRGNAATRRGVPDDEQPAHTLWTMSMSTSPAQTAAAASRSLSLAEYRACVASLERPTRAQMEAFAAFVCQAHSWYKHLPFYPPGKPLQFFLDPAAGMDLFFNASGVDAAPRDVTGFHYSAIPTRDYRERFGCLAFSRSSGTTVFRMAEDGTALAPGDDAPAIYDASSRSLRTLPAEVVQAGVASISGLVHKGSCQARFMLRYRLPVEPNGWPQESGGPAELERIIQYAKWRRRQLESSDERMGWSEDPTLAQLLAPERHRQRMGMVGAMTRVLALLD